jgi:histidine ammonia-lyase
VDLVLDGASLTLDGLADAALERRHVTLSPEARARIARCRTVVDRAVESGAAIYGVTTGFGKLSDLRIPRDQLARLQTNLVRSHAAGVGQELEVAEVRAALAVRANSLARGFSGVRPVVVELLVELLNRGVHPIVPSRGSVGASGDLAPSAHLSLVLIGEGVAEYRGERLPGAEALRRAGLEPLQLEAKEGLSLLNGTHFMAAVGGLACRRALTLLDTADLAGALSLEVLLGTPAATDPRIHSVRSHPGQLESAANLARLVAGSAIVASHHDCGRVQDAYSLRCIPQVHGAVRDALRHVCAIVEREMNSATDNPLVFPEEAEGAGAILSGGNFHGAPLAYGFDYAALALADLAGISERRLERLVNPDLSGLPAFLSVEPGLSSGYMILQVTAAALVSENKVLAHPASVDSIPTSANKEDHVSMGMSAALKLREVVRNAELVVAGENRAACPAMVFRRPLDPGPGTGAACRMVRALVPPPGPDREIAPEIEAVARLVRSGQLARIVSDGRTAPAPSRPPVEPGPKSSA